MNYGRRGGRSLPPPGFWRKCHAESVAMQMATLECCEGREIKGGTGRDEAEQRVKNLTSWRRPCSRRVEEEAELQGGVAIAEHDVTTGADWLQTGKPPPTVNCWWMSLVGAGNFLWSYTVHTGLEHLVSKQELCP
ncbi:unnamed protein product [Pleuronectes platessa]|uniref:Uncharacterized protein n=1 Tax=Pleuronectes platessa TaxID=8262 RepID=A0A9N7UCP9_PLEPL|nr:unnamed protein product [Pleuronectes platessa]